MILSLSLQAQYKIAFVHPTINGTKFSITIHISTESIPFNLGTNNIRFDYPKDYLTNPIIVSESFPAISYESTNLKGSNTTLGYLSINTALSNKNHSNPLVINRKGIDLITVEFDIINSTAISVPFRMRINDPKLNTIIIAENTQKAIKMDGIETTEVDLYAYSPKHNNMPTEQRAAFPNPTEHLINIVLHTFVDNIAKIDFYNNQGQLVKSIDDIYLVKGENIKTLDINDLPIGVYTMRISQANQITTQRIQKI